MSAPAKPPIFPGLAFTHAVSLGADCEPAHQLRRLGRLSVRGLFDWLVTPLTSIPDILADDGARVGADFICANEGTSVRCAAYDLLYHHEFRRMEDGRVRFNAEAVERCRSKMSHKYKGFVEGCTPPGPVLFLRSGPETDLPWDPHGAQKGAVRPRDLNGLARALEWRLPGLEFRLLVIALSGGAEIVGEDGLDDRIRVERVTRRNQQGWKLSDDDWDAVFARIGFAAPPSPDPSPLGETLFWSGQDDAAAKGGAAPDGAALRALFDKGLALQRSGAAWEAAQTLDRAFDAGFRSPVPPDLPRPAHGRGALSGRPAQDRATGG